MEQVEVWRPPTGVSVQDVGQKVCAFLDVATTAYGRASHYNTREEQEAAELAAHGGLMALDRGLYSVLLLLPGATDRSRQLGSRSLLETHPNGAGLLNQAQEREVLVRLTRALPPQRLLKGFVALRQAKVNNSRTRKLILGSLLSSPRLELWSVKYRSKMAVALTHAVGERRAGILRSILSKEPAELSSKEARILRSFIDRFRGRNSTALVRQSVGFVLGSSREWTFRLFAAYEAAKLSLDAGSKLPMEVLEGLRSTYHPSVPKERVLELTSRSGSMTATQRKNVQRRAHEVGIEVDMDPSRFGPVELYLYAFEMGMDQSIIEALGSKAVKAAQGFPAKYGKVGILIDGSKSMEGSKDQPLRPMAVALATRDMLCHACEDFSHVVVGGQLPDKGGFVRPSGDTPLGEGLVELLRSHYLTHKALPDAVFILSDGYENSPAGRVSEVVVRLRQMGAEFPIFHLNPVLGAETGQVRDLCEGHGVTTMPVRSPGALGTTIIRGLVETDPVRGINQLVQAALPEGPSGLLAQPKEG